MTENITAQDYEAFRLFLEEVCGIVLGDNKQYLIYSRLRHLMEKYEINTLGELVSQAKKDNGVVLRGRIIDAMTTNETSWFRDSYPYDVLKEVIYPELVEKGNTDVRIWSAASSTGQEPYSISIITDEFLRSRFNSLSNVQIVATDISQGVLNSAKHGVYDSISIGRGLSEERIQRYFDSLNGNWIVKDAIRKRIKFTDLNLTHNFSTMGKFDVIYCRNVLIYFSSAVKYDIIQRMSASLKPEGYLILGGSESIPQGLDKFGIIRYKNGMVYKLLPS